MLQVRPTPYSKDTLRNVLYITRIFCAFFVSSSPRHFSKWLLKYLANNVSFFFNFFKFFAVLGVRCCAWTFSSCGERGLLFVAVRGLRIVVASLVAEHRL